MPISNLRLGFLAISFSFETRHFQIESTIRTAQTTRKKNCSNSLTATIISFDKAYTVVHNGWFLEQTEALIRSRTRRRYAR